MSFYPERGNPYFSGYNFAHYEEKLRNEEAKSSSLAAIDQAPAYQLKLPPIAGAIPIIGGSQTKSISPTMSVANAPSVSEDIEADWDRQMQILQEVDQLGEEAKQLIPSDLNGPLFEFIEQLPGLKRVVVFKLFQEYQWEHRLLTLVLDLFRSVDPSATLLPMVQFMYGLVPQHLHRLSLQLFHKMVEQPQLIHEWVVETSLVEGHYLMQIARHLPEFELQVMADNLLSLSSVANMLNAFHYTEAHRKTAKHCALCRQKRMHNMHFRMVNGQVPPSTLTIPGVLPLYDTATVWSADDERQYTFDETLGQIYWQKAPVNLVEICDNCLSEVHKAISNQGRHEPIHHIDAEVRKPAMRAVRDVEQSLAGIIFKVANERKQRRLREFTLSAVKLQGTGLRKEAEEREAAEAEAARLAAVAQAQKERQHINAQALEVDGKWKRIDRKQDMDGLAFRNRYALVQHHMGFGAHKAAPRNRENAKTWKLNNFDDEGLPVTEDAAQQVFGMASIEKHDGSPLLNIWKSIADEKHALFKRKQRELEEERRRIAMQNFQTLQDYIKERSNVLDRQQAQMKHLQEQEEVRRLQQRKYEKDERRRLRWEAYLATEREHMETEDRRSHALRAYIEEIRREDYEREGMFNAECDQREVDRFWGLDYYEEQLALEEARLREFYQQRLMSLNHELRVMGCMKGSVRVEVRPIGNIPDEAPYMEAPRKKATRQYSTSTSSKGAEAVEEEESEIDLQKLRAQEHARRLYVIKKLKAEEVRSKLKMRMKTVFF